MEITYLEKEPLLTAAKRLSKMSAKSLPSLSAESLSTLSAESLKEVLDKKLADEKKKENVIIDEEDPRCIYLVDEITKETYDVIYEIIDINKEDRGVPIEEREPIRIYIDTPGGELEVAQAISDIIRMSKTPVRVIGIGNVYSAGALILVTSPKGSRYMLPSSTMLIHDGYFQLGEVTAYKGPQVWENIKKTYNRQLDFFASSCNVDKETIRNKAIGEWFLSAEEALELGMIDHVVKDIEELF